MVRRHWAFGLAAAVSVSCAFPAVAQTDPKPTEPPAESKPMDLTPIEPKQMSLDDIRAIITSLGYELQPNPYPEIKVVNDKGVFFVGFSLSQNNTIVSDYIILHTIPAEKLKAMPVCKIFYFNDTHTTYFSLNNKDADRRIILNSQITAGAASPKTVRAMIETIVADTVGSDKLWNPDLWTDATFPGDCAPPEP